ncbi:hypothetical protein GUJ93_ZPchr0002g23136 [Zizania palustris]|uniref:Uncharacterized protein n=1 Tax=Zizania palustris TaxID=103762 RepID=A0A8J5V3K6_ZIZPA|nr:hypothetical protein GUJ93_ZPchr0002g23136 [Zizania palustris]
MATNQDASPRVHDHHEQNEQRLTLLVGTRFIKEWASKEITTEANSECIVQLVIMGATSIYACLQAPVFVGFTPDADHF